MKILAQLFIDLLQNLDNLKKLNIECLTFEDISPAAILTNVKSQNLEHLLIGGCSFKKDCTLLNQGKKYPLKNFILNNEHYNPEQERDDFESIPSKCLTLSDSAIHPPLLFRCAIIFLMRLMSFFSE